ncbi:Hypothetical predicted protein [Mytilus galloprovincialis]|uniref:Uncharacterized protein n=1 Tax=Mytilus galloprovincialis TaxID=29158 RepID=A0A8B6E3R0_MYTGA|nr:Hypothetical predicted protein [Mytilus galloprovincialis]
MIYYINLEKKVSSDRRQWKNKLLACPLKVESVWAKVPEAELTAPPWERKRLLKKGNTQALTPADCIPSLRTDDGKTWSGVPFDGATEDSTKIKLKMMDIDLL